MDIIRLVIAKPVGTTVAVFLVVMFGLIGLTQIPIQLTPTVDKPIVTVTTLWPGADPQEIVDEVTKEQEEELKNVSNLKRMVSTTRAGESEITLEFYLGTDIGRALSDVDDALRQVGDYPDDVEAPTRKSAEGGDASSAIAWIIIDLDPEARAKHPDFDITTLFYDLDREMKPALERVDGVAEVNIYGGRDREVRVKVDPLRLAQRGLNHLDVARALQEENEDASAGSIDESKREYRIRLIGRFTRVEQVLDTIVSYGAGGPVYVRDVAEVEIGYEKQRGFIRSFGEPAIAVNCIRQTGANVVEVMAGVRAALEDVKATVLPALGGYTIQPDGTRLPVGPDLRLKQVYDETVYIDSAVSLVTDNLWVGGILAAGVLLIFLRSVVATGVISLAIPISVIGTFLVMLAFGRTLNVISLAGLAFAVGMVVDNAIVVLENIDRRMSLGESPAVAAYRGTKEMWSAILASTLTTVAVFIPVLTIQEEAGQLFRDIALAVVASVSLSLIVAITVIPCACSRWLRPKRNTKHGLAYRLFDRLCGLVWLGGQLTRGLGAALKWAMTGWRAWTVRPGMIVTMTALSVVGAIVLAPPLDYLPAGNRNLVFGGLLIPPGLSLETRQRIAEGIEAQVEPYARAELGAAEGSVPGFAPIARFDMENPMSPPPPFAPVGVEHFFIGAFQGSMFCGAVSKDEQVVIPVGQLLTNAMSSVPDAFGGAEQTSLFGRGIGSGNTIDVEISGPSLARVVAAADRAAELARTEYGPTSVRPSPANFNLNQQEVRLEVNRRGRELGLRNRDVGTVAQSLFDGALVGEFLADGKALDMRLVPPGQGFDYKEQLAGVPVFTPAGRVVPLDSVVDIVPGLAPQEIRRIEELPSVTVQILPPGDRPLQTVIEEIREKIVVPVTGDASLWDRQMRANLEGTAASLSEVQSAFFGAVNQESAGAVASLRKTLRDGAVWIVSPALLALGVVGAAVCLVRAAMRRDRRLINGALGAVIGAAVLAGVVLLFGTNPQLVYARMVWALVVTYLLMCALFESYVEPFVIMFTVPLAIVGGFAGLALVHAWTLSDPTRAPQNLDVLTMLGFVLLIGVVVNNAILLVYQAQNFMRGVGESEDDRIEAMDPITAIAESVRTRVRPIMMTVMTSVGGMLPLILFPGAGSEMYRGLGAVLVGGLVVSTFFTLVLVPLVYSWTYEMRAGLKLGLGRRATRRAAAPAPAAEVAAAG